MRQISTCPMTCEQISGAIGPLAPKAVVADRTSGDPVRLVIALKHFLLFLFQVTYDGRCI
jgi:hypothetical protein